MKRLSLFVILFVFAGSLLATSPMKSRGVAGGIVVMPLSLHQKTGLKAYYKKKRVMLLRSQGESWAVIGIPYWQSPKPLVLSVYQGDTVKKFPVPLQRIVREKSAKKIAKRSTKKKPRYVQQIQIHNTELVSPGKENQARIKQEKKDFQCAARLFRETNAINLHFKRPVPGRITSYFGIKRLYNGHLKGWHRGLDFAGKLGTPVRAASSGVVVLAGRYFYNGNTVFIDHGQGLLTLYAHLNRIRVKKGERVQQGERIGDLGSTGRSTGPHLHFGVILNQERVNPLYFFS